MSKLEGGSAAAACVEGWGGGVASLASRAPPGCSTFVISASAGSGLSDPESEPGGARLSKERAGARAAAASFINSFCTEFEDVEGLPIMESQQVGTLKET